MTGEFAMTSVRNVLVVGGGTAGCVLAALLGRAGVAVEIVERKPDFTTYGSGITLQGAALRVLRQVGVWDDLRRYGYEFNSLGLRSADGRMLAEIPDARTGGPDLPATLGAYRPKLAELLAEAAVGAGVKVRLGETVESINQDGDGVDVTFSGGDTARYDLLVGADGIRSRTRAQLGIDTQPQPVGMGIWRVHASRPEEVVRTDLIYDGPCYIAGYCPTGPDILYAYLVEDAQDRAADTPEEKVAAMRELATAYHGPWDAIREDITDADRINYALFEHLLIEGPWNRGRAIVIGDAAHACPPTLALGAALALEDAAVLAEILLASDELTQEVFDEFVERRIPRARVVIEGSMQLANWLLERKRDADVPGLMGRVMGMMSQPA
jgi:2-polyprenyl-6-methoxyphenol hydroxylase-like FAD-dependent oxidoreductase